MNNSGRRPVQASLYKTPDAVKKQKMIGQYKNAAFLEKHKNC
jgi:hypothetical protein